ncbi:hypothetical protein PC41400_23190 [Paenibacillus chitinolyticus]|uniref:Uncharacterized protein n=1 Tax=Paenibacillus chitinolyticus TaxID=79263 RepID=A0A410X1D0_9BACL|nr:hypothetical protein PC41400_23190 [Paenibacillus chitinolyticus]
MAFFLLLRKKPAQTEMPWLKPKVCFVHLFYLGQNQHEAMKACRSHGCPLVHERPDEIPSGLFCRLRLRCKKQL